MVFNKDLAAEAYKIARKLNIANLKATNKYLANWKHDWCNNVAWNKWQLKNRGRRDSLHTMREICSMQAYFYVYSYNHTLYYIANMDETMDRFDISWNRTNSEKGVTTIRIANTRCSRRGFTVVMKMDRLCK